MKKILSPLVVSILVLSLGCARLTRVSEKERTIQTVQKVELSADEIYDRALEWMAKNLTASGETILVKDREKHKIIGRGSGKYKEYFNLLVTRPFSYSITVETKDGRYRVTLENFAVYYDERVESSSEASWAFEMKKIASKMDEVIEGLHGYIAKGAQKEKSADTEEEW